MTMASSTTIPSTIIKANNDTILILIPNNGIIIIAPKKHTGKPIITQSASLKRKKIDNIMATKIAPWKRLVFIMSKRAFR